MFASAPRFMILDGFFYLGMRCDGPAGLCRGRNRSSNIGLCVDGAVPNVSVCVHEIISANHECRKEWR